MHAVAEAPVDEILSLRAEYRREMACQIVHDSWHERGFTRSFLLHADGEVVGYGSVGGALREPKETVKELYVVPHLRGSTLSLFRLLVEESSARRRGADRGSSSARERSRRSVQTACLGTC